MIVHSIDPTSQRILTATVPDGALSSAQLAILARHEPVHIADRWIFGPLVNTTEGPVPHDRLEFRAGITPRSGEPGSCDARWIEARFKGQERLVMRAVDVLAHGVEVKMQQEAGQVN